jgi:hypothetical protein
MQLFKNNNFLYTLVSGCLLRLKQRAICSTSLFSREKSFIFFVLLGIILFMVYKSYSFSIIYCDGGETMYSLKINLTTEVHSYRVHLVNYELFTDVYNQMVLRPMAERDYTNEVQLLDGSRKTFEYMTESYGKITNLVDRIRSLDPTFQSPLQSINYLRVGR